jgi:hypothetical protein
LVGDGPATAGWGVHHQPAAAGRSPLILHPSETGRRWRIPPRRPRVSPGF